MPPFGSLLEAVFDARILPESSLDSVNLIRKRATIAGAQPRFSQPNSQTRDYGWKEFRIVRCLVVGLKNSNPLTHLKLLQSLLLDQRRKTAQAESGTHTR